MNSLVERFLKYVQIDTDSNPESNACPSSEIQWDLAKVIVEDLKALGMEDITLDENCYIMATLPANCDEDIPAIGFIAHMDTAPSYNGRGVKPRIVENYNGEDIVLPANCDEDIPAIGFIAHMDTAPSYNGRGVKPRIVENYNGEDIVLNADGNVVLSPKDFAHMKNYIGQDLIVTDGSSLLGADDKAGIVEIIEAIKYLNVVLSPKDFAHMKNYIGQDLIVTDGSSLLGADDKAGIVEIIEAIKYLKEHPEIKHGVIKVGFTPDEEIGRGADLFDVQKFDCKFAYTVDGELLKLDLLLMKRLEEGQIYLMFKNSIVNLLIQ